MKKCSVCNRIYDDSQSFCLDDGTALIVDPTLHTADTVVMTPKKKSPVPFIFVGLIALLIIGIFAAWLILQRSYPDRAAQGSSANIQPGSTPIQIVKNTASPTPFSTPSPSSSPEVTENLPANSDTVSASRPADITDPTKLPPIMKTEDHSVLFNLHQCRKSGSSITCDFTFTNKGPDRQFQFVIDRSNLFDELGNTYNGRNGFVASTEGNEPRINFVSGVTAKAQMTFESIQPNAVKIMLLRIQYDVGDDRGLEVKFRNVPLLIPK